MTPHILLPAPAPPRHGRPRFFDSVVLLVPLVLLILSTAAMATEEPRHRIVETFPAFELREYAPHLVAETTVDAAFDKAGNRAFGILADYIFGNNKAKQKIEMTAPVNQQPASSGRSEKIEMTAPVTQRPATGTGAERYVLSFVMPRRFTLETLPTPNDPRVTLREEPARLMAVRGYSGRWTQANYRREEARLLEAVKAQGFEPIGAPVYARYNSPFSLPFMRRNEVMVEVTRPD